MCGDDGCNRREITELAVSRLYSQYTPVKALAVSSQLLAAVSLAVSSQYWQRSQSLAVCIDSNTRSFFTVTRSCTRISSQSLAAISLTVSSQLLAAVSLAVSSQSLLATLAVSTQFYFIDQIASYPFSANVFQPETIQDMLTGWKRCFIAWRLRSLISEIFLKQYLRSYDVRSSLAGSKACETSCELYWLPSTEIVWEDFVRAESVYAGYIQCIRHNVFTIQYSFYINRQYRDTNWNYVNRHISMEVIRDFQNHSPLLPMKLWRH